jgi:hypothetical protein
LSGKVIKGDEMARHVAQMERTRNVCILLVKPEGKRPLGRPMHIEGRIIKILV